MEPCIFISHRSTDEKVAEMLRVFLVCVGVPNELIFCSSLPGNDIQQKISEEVKSKIKSSAVNIAILSRDYYESAYCLNEAGIIWLRDEIAAPIIIALPEISDKEMRGFLNREYKPRRLDSITDITSIYDIIRSKFSFSPVSSTVIATESQKLADQYKMFLASRTNVAAHKEATYLDLLESITTDDERIALYYIAFRKVRRVSCESFRDWLQEMEIYDVSIDNAFDLLSSIGSGAVRENTLELDISLFRECSANAQTIIEQLSEVTNNHIESSAEVFRSLWNSRRFDAAEKLFVAYIVDEKPQKLGARWMTELEVRSIKAWEDKNSLESILSENYESCLAMFIHYRLVYESEWTSEGNARAYTLCTSLAKLLLDNSEPLRDEVEDVKKEYSYELPF